MLRSGCPLFFFWFLVFQSLFQGFWGIFQWHQLQLVSSSTSCYFPTLWQDQSICLFFPFLLLLLSLMLEGQNPLDNKFFSFLLINIWFSFLAGIKWSVCISKSQKILCVSCSRTDSGLCIYHLLVWSNFSLLYNSRWIKFSTQSCLLLYSFSASLRHSLMCLTV